jgi:hypothetical protein
MSFLNVAVTLFGSSDQRNVIGVSPDAHEKLIYRLDEALEELSLTEAQKTDAVVELAKSKGDLESIERLVSGFLRAIFHMPTSGVPDELRLRFSPRHNGESTWTREPAAFARSTMNYVTHSPAEWRS